MMYEDRIWRLIARKLAGEASETEIRELDSILKQDASLGQYLEILSSVWSNEKRDKTEVLEIYDRINDRLELQMNKSKRLMKRAELEEEENNHHFEPQIQPSMLKNFLKLGWRNIVRNKAYSLINVLGLAMGLCACIVIFLILRYEFSFDRFHPASNRIFRITGEFQRATGEREFLNSPVSDVAAFETAIPGFEARAALFTYDPRVAIPGGKDGLKQLDGTTRAIITNSAYFDLFKYDWLAGQPIGSLDGPNRVVITENQAEKYFGNVSADKLIGKSIVYDDSLHMTITGVIADWKSNTDLNYTDFLSIATAPHSFLKGRIPTEDWKSLSPHQSMAFVRLNRSTTAKQVNARFEAYINQHVKIPDGGKLTMRLQALKDMHFTGDFHRGDDGDSFRKAYLPTLYTLIGAALFILIIAVVNFVNLATAQSIHRAREIGVRKVLGSRKRSLVFQFLTETFLLTLCSALIAMLFVAPTLSLFRSFIPAGIVFDLTTGNTLVFILIATILTALLAGFYPARVLASYRPAISLKGVTRVRSGLWNIRKGLIVFQFTFSLLFILGAIVINRQIRFMTESDKGFKTDAIVTINNWGDASGKMEVLRNRLKSISGIEQVITQGNAPMGFAHRTVNLKSANRPESPWQVSAEIGDADFIGFYQMKLLAGRNLERGDSLKELLINETFSRQLGYKQPNEAVGQFLYGGDVPFTIVGVVGDFHEGSYHETIGPMIIENIPDWRQSMAIKLASNGMNRNEAKDVLTRVEIEWKKLYPEQAFSYSFLDDSITWLYEQEQKTAQLVNAAMFITIFISCMGLFGLVMFMAVVRTKEIGIRKVLGASVMNIVTMLGKDFVRIVGISVIIASPIAWYLMNQWLQDFAYRINISVWIFILGGLAAISIALLTICVHAIRAALANPVKSLRVE